VAVAAANPLPRPLPPAAHHLQFAGSFTSNLCIQVAAKGSEQQTLMMTIRTPNL